MKYEFIQVPPNGTRITINADGSINVPDRPIIPFIEGDGIGPEIMDEALRVPDALELPDISVERALVGGAAYHQHGHPLPGEGVGQVAPASIRT